MTVKGHRSEERLSVKGCNLQQRLSIVRKLGGYIKYVGERGGGEEE